MKECERFIELLRKTFGDEPDGARLAVKWFDHEFGAYCEVVCWYDTEDEKARDYAFRCENEMPLTWEEGSVSSFDLSRAKAKFRLGTIVATSWALECFERTGENPFDFLRRHVEGDWGDLCPEDKEENELSVDEELRILSAYHLKDGTKIWIITEADRSSTCFLLSSEY